MRGACGSLGLWLCCLLTACEDPATERAGAPCAADRACGELVCRAELGATPVDLTQLALTCGELTSGQAPGVACERADDCDRGLCLLSGACARACDHDDACARTERCQAIYVRTGKDTLARSTACVSEVDLPDDVQMTRSTAAVSGYDTLALPPLAANTLYVVRHPGDHTWPIPSSTSLCRPPLCAHSLRTAGPDSRLLFDVTDDVEPENPVATGYYVNPLTVWAPNGPRLAADIRAYELEVESTVAGTVQITALARANNGLRLDLNLYYVGVAGLQVQDERGVPQLRAALDELDRIFEQAQIYLGDVRQIAVPGALPTLGSQSPGREVSAGFSPLRTQYRVLPELPALFELSAGASDVALDVFFVSDIQGQGGADLAGLAGGTPVPFGMHGTAGSGVVIAASMFLAADDPAQFGRSLAHELGHALGLFHTSELDGRVVDPLPDTAACTSAEDANHDGSLDAMECAAHGGDNLMFPTVAGGTVLTEQQSAVLRRALVLQ